MSTEPTDFFADITDEEFDRVNAMDADELRNYRIRTNAHIANGGERAQATCPSCTGRGAFVAYTGRTVGRCFKCQGTGKVSKGVAAAAKGKATFKANREQWYTDHADVVAYMRKRIEGGSNFYQGLADKAFEYGRLTDKQLELVRADMAREEEKRAEWKARDEAKGGEVDIAAIVALFNTATDNQIKRPVFRVDLFEISKAPMTGANPGALYVKDYDDRYLGKIVNGKFHASRDATDKTLDQLRAIAADPLAESIKYARRTGRCGCCGRTLVDPVSILAGIGPICASRWGLDWRRELASTEYANMKAEEAEKATLPLMRAAPVATPATATNTATFAGSKKRRVAEMLRDGTTVANIIAELGVSDAAAKALIGDVRRMGIPVTRDGDVYRA